MVRIRRSALTARWSDHLGESTGGHVPAYVHLEEPILRSHVTLGAKKIL